MKLVISAIEDLTPSLKRFTFTGDEIKWAGPGSHLTFELPGMDRVLKNTYSLIREPVDSYQIIVRRVEKSRGGSHWLHDQAQCGDVVVAHKAQNFFYPPRSAKQHLLLSAGIGLTPFLSYLKTPGLVYELHHFCKLDEGESFRALLPDADNIVLHTNRNAIDLHELLLKQNLGTHLSVCGPENFMDFVVSVAKSSGFPSSKIHLESFGGARGGKPFVVHLKRSSKTINVKDDESLLEALEAEGLNPPCLCRGGACGACQMRVLEGKPDHHDHYLSNEMKCSGETMMICVSRALTPEIVLDF